MPLINSPNPGLYVSFSLTSSSSIRFCNTCSLLVCFAHATRPKMKMAMAIYFILTFGFLLKIILLCTLIVISMIFCSGIQHSKCIEHRLVLYCSMVLLWQIIEMNSEFIIPRIFQFVGQHIGIYFHDMGCLTSDKTFFSNTNIDICFLCERFPQD